MISGRRNSLAGLAMVKLCFIQTDIAIMQVHPQFTAITVFTSSVLAMDQWIRKWPSCLSVTGLNPNSHQDFSGKSPKIYGGIISMVFDHSGFISPDIAE